MIGLYTFLTTCIVSVSVGRALPFEVRHSPQGHHRVGRAAAFDSELYLEQYGYLEKSRADTDETHAHSEESRKHAISTFQKMAGINVTGEMNRETSAKMFLPRCGFPDITRDFDPTQALHFNAVNKWKNNTVTWQILAYSGKLTRDKQRQAIIDGFDHWAKASDLHLLETDEHADIEIGFVAGNHGDGVANQFYGKGGVLAHAFLPSNGNTHFDEDEDWKYHSNDGTELESVAVHEFGHALGLHHSAARGSIMAPFYTAYVPNFRLASDDIAAIQYLYGPPGAMVSAQNPNGIITPTTDVLTTPTETKKIKTAMNGTHSPVDSASCIVEHNTVVVTVIAAIALFHSLRGE